MGLFSKNKKVTENNAPVQTEIAEVKKLSMFITIVNKGQGNYVLKLFESEGANAQFIQHGDGTAVDGVNGVASQHVDDRQTYAPDEAGPD